MENYRENYIFFLIDGQPLFNTASEICLQNVDDNSIHFAKMNPEIYQILKKEFPNSKLPCVEDKQTTPTPLASPSSVGDNLENSSIAQQQKHWSRPATLNLIQLRKKFDDKFKSTTIKNEQVWQMVAQEMHSCGFYFNACQCRDKWQYLKKRYMRKCDNSGPRGTGEDPINFEYFDELHELLGKKHNVNPPAIASSLRRESDGTSQEMSEASVLEESAEDERHLKKVKKNTKKKDVVVKFMEDLQEYNNKKEANRERRHQELVDCRNRATDAFSEKMDELISTLKK